MVDYLVGPQQQQQQMLIWQNILQLLIIYTYLEYIPMLYLILCSWLGKAYID